MAEFDIVIAGAGSNGLFCGAALARAGLKVAVVERNPWIGGGVVTREVTLPGFKHDMYGSSHVWIHTNPLFRELRPELEEYGLKYIWSKDNITGHPFWDDTSIVVYHDVDKTVSSIGQFSEKDARRYRDIYDSFINIKDGFLHQMFSPPNPPSLLVSALETTEEGLEMLRNYNLSLKDFVCENFEEPHVRSFILSWAMAPPLYPTSEGKGELFWIMIPAIHTYGESIPEGGSMELPKAIARYIEGHGGKVMVNAPVVRFIVEDGEAKGVELADGQKILANKAVVTNIEPKQAFLKLVEPGILDEKFLRKVKNYDYGMYSVERIHLALNEPPKFKAGEEVDKCAFWRMAGTVEDMERHYAEILMGELPSNPGLWAACWTKMDPSRAPEGKHTLILDTFVPQRLSGGRSWEDQDLVENYRKVILDKFREYTSNMGDDNILAYYVDTPITLERDNPNHVNGNTVGGVMSMAQGGYFRPFPGWSQYRTPIKRLYMAGPFTHPGGGISGAGIVPAGVILEDLGLKDPDEF
jgi:phytoene dehydrogenase-like protein